MKKIIAAVDFSSVSKNAAYYAADLASQINAELLLANVVEVPMSMVGMPETSYAIDNVIEDSEQELLQLRTELAKHVNDRVKITTCNLAGSVAYSLQELAKKENPFCIVVGTDRMTAAEHLLVRNHALAAAQSVNIPVLIIPPETSFKEITSVVLASDLRGCENIRALQTLKDWIRPFNIKLDVLNVVDGVQPTSEGVTCSRTLLNELSEFNPEYHFIDNNKVKEGVDNYIDQHHSDLLVIMPGRHGFVDGLFHKSESKRLIQNPPVPVLSIHK